IGPAGENRDNAASIQHTDYSSARRLGGGAMSGDKNLKASVVHGTKDINIAQPAEFLELCEWLIKKAVNRRLVSETSYRGGPSRSIKCDTGWFGNADERPDEFENYGEIHFDYVDKHLMRDHLIEPACDNCPFPCRKLPLPLPDGRVRFYKDCISFAFSFACKITDVTFALKCYDLAVGYGLDTLSTGKLVGFAIDLYQKGILTKEDTDGMPLEFGNEEVAFKLIEKIARREGIGDTLANGVYEAARAIGRGAEEHTYLVKKSELMADFIKRNPHGALILATNDRLDNHANANCLRRVPSLSEWRQARREDIEGGWWSFPDEFEKYLDVDYSASYEGTAELIHYHENVKTLTDLAGLCWFYTGFGGRPIIKTDKVRVLISYATGMDIDQSEALKIASRTRTLIRAINVREGLRRKDDTVPEKFFREEPPARLKPWGFMKLDHDKFDKELDEYYELRGWDNEGIPTAETLEKLGLDDVRQDLEQKGILAKITVTK
ncbi:MAG: hypothetical protein HY529_02330, partial [Chloroflexi bacterium]|nr:hypothetical protein [Chloroflexota bacterium]